MLPTVEKPGGILDQQERELLQQQGILLSDATFDPLSNELQFLYAADREPFGENALVEAELLLGAQ